jgi:hypothetical protein
MVAPTKADAETVAGVLMKTIDEIKASANKMGVKSLLDFLIYFLPFSGFSTSS